VRATADGLRVEGGTIAAGAYRRVSWREAAHIGGGGTSSPVPANSQSVQSAVRTIPASSEARANNDEQDGENGGRRVANTFDTYILGPIAGQQGWLISTCGYSLSHIDATATYPNAKFSGKNKPSKVLVVQNATDDGCYNGLGSPPVANPAGTEDSYTVPFPTWTVCGEACRNTFSARWTITSSTGGYQPGIAISVSPVYNNDGARMAYVGMEYVPAPHTSKPSLHIFSYDVKGVCPPGTTATCGNPGPPPCFQCANFVYHSIAYINPNVEHTIGLVMHFEGRRDRVDVSIDGETGTGGSWQDYYTMDTESDPDGMHRHSRAVNDLLLHATARTASASSTGTSPSRRIRTGGNSPGILGRRRLFRDVQLRGQLQLYLPRAGDARPLRRRDRLARRARRAGRRRSRRAERGNVHSHREADARRKLEGRALLRRTRR
jgi:hypothetical protein